MDELKELLGEELFNQLSSKLGDTKIAIISDGNWIPKQKFDQVNEQVKELKEQLSERDKQLDELSKKAKYSNELQKIIDELKELNKKTQKEYEDKLSKQQKDFAISEALRTAGAKNQRAVMALLDLETIKLDGKELLGIKEQLEKLKETDAYLFGEDVGGVGGREPHPPSTKYNKDTKNPWSKEHFNLTEQGKLLKEDPELAKILIAQAK